MRGLVSACIEVLRLLFVCAGNGSAVAVKAEVDIAAVYGVEILDGVCFVIVV